VRWGPNRRKEAWASGGRPRKGGARGTVGVARERKEEKRALVPFCAEVTHAPGRREGGEGSSAGVTRRGERGGARQSRNPGVAGMVACR
jgi:hypothetical protein